MKVWSVTKKIFEGLPSIDARFFKASVLSLALLTMAFCSGSLRAQTSLGQISGTITDSTNSLVHGASVTVTEIQTNQIRTTTTDEGGYFILTNLPIGDYIIEVKSAGFRGEKRSGISITADAKITANFSLVVGAVSAEVNVTAMAGEAINTTSGELAHVIDTKQVAELPLNGRNYIQLMTIIPGAVVTNPDVFSVTTSLAAGNQNINGNKSDSNNLTVDGAFNLASGSNGCLSITSVPTSFRKSRLPPRTSPPSTAATQVQHSTSSPRAVPTSSTAACLSISAITTSTPGRSTHPSRLTSSTTTSATVSAVPSLRIVFSSSPARNGSAFVRLRLPRSAPRRARPRLRVTSRVRASSYSFPEPPTQFRTTTLRL